MADGDPTSQTSGEQHLGIGGISDAQEIGRGGFGIVYRANEIAFGRTVAIKVLTGEFDDRSRVRFDRECLALGSLSGHPNIVTVHRSGFTDSGKPFLVMEYLAGGSVADSLAESHRFQWQDCARIGAEIGSALSLAHTNQILHRDIKPGNILLSVDGTAKLADFGIARLQGAPETQSAVVTASVAHAPPEVLAGRRPDERADIYSLGSAVFEMLYGRPAFVGDDEETLVPMLVRISQDEPPRLSGEVPGPMVDALHHALAKAPDDRPQTASAFADMLRLALGDSGTANSPGEVDQTRTRTINGGLPNGPPNPPVSGTPAKNSGSEGDASADLVAPDNGRRPRSRTPLVLGGLLVTALGALLLLRSMMGSGGSSNVLATTQSSPEASETGSTVVSGIGVLGLDASPSSSEDSNPTSSVPPQTLTPTTTAPRSVPTTVKPATISSAPPSTAATPEVPLTAIEPSLLSLVDQTGALTMTVDGAWGEWRSGQGVLVAAPDLAAFDRGEYVEGVGLEAGFDFSGTVDIAEAIHTSGLNDECVLLDWNVDEVAGVQSGYASFENCGGTGLQVLLIGSYVPSDGSFLIQQVQFYGAATRPVVQVIIDSVYLDQSQL